MLDHAADNVIRQNSFIDVTYGVRVEDDGNQVLDNHFTASSPDHHAVLVGTPFRNDVLGEPVTGTVLEGNVSDIVGNPDPYRWIDGASDTTGSGNMALGAPSSICPESSRPAARSSS